MRTFEHTCKGKQKFRTYNFAYRIASKIFIREGVGSLMDVYHCPFCKYYHMGHSPDNKREQNFRKYIFRIG